jgi:DNA-binding NtrC family response regulator
MSRILVVEDEPSILSVLSTLLRSEGYEVDPVLGGDKALDALKNESYDLLVSDIRMSPVDGMELLRLARKEFPEMAVIMVTAYGSVETAVDAMKYGAFDYVTKPFKVDELLMTVQRALEYNSAIVENVQLKKQLQARYQFENIVAESVQMRKVCEMIERVAPADTTVLIQGESGTGKEVVAKAIHGYSNRKSKEFIAINCAAMPEQLLESELFGHVKGAFTGATSTKDGLFEAADGGTIFLDEIGSMPLNLQGKLLRVLQEREIRKVGGTATVPVDVRVLAATNERLEKGIENGNFREDLYYRLSVIPIDIPPLRERPDDILPLVYHVLRNHSRDKENLPEIDPDAQITLENYRWPGNVRELENAIRHACTFATDGKIRKNDLPAKMLDAAGSTAPLSDGNLADVISSDTYKGQSLKAFLRNKEKEYLGTVLNYMEGDKAQAAKALKISLATLYRKLPEPVD